LNSIYLIAPSGASYDDQSPLTGIAWLENQGIRIQNTECVKRVFQRFSGNDAQRLQEINHLANLDPQTIVMAMRGGYGIHRLLPDIQWQAIAQAIQKGLQVCGHSDFTAFELALLAKTGAITLSGPMLNYDFGRLTDDGQPIAPDDFMWKHFVNAVQSRKLDCSIQAQQSYLGKSSDGRVQGMLWGGNLTVLASLIGTPYLPSAKQTQGGILFLEDVNEHPYRIERMLWQLLESGFLQSQSAIILGDFSAYKLSPSDNGYDLQRAIERINKELINRGARTKILTGLPLGHIRDKVTLPVGAIGTLTASPQGFNLRSSW